MPVSLYVKFDKLIKVRDEYLAGKHNSKNRLQAAQWAFNLAKRALKHMTKVVDKLAKDHPHKPVVNAINASTTSLSSSVLLSRDDIISQLHHIVGAQQHIMEAQRDLTTVLISEIQELRRVSLPGFFE